MHRHLSNILIAVLLVSAALVTPRVWDHFHPEEPAQRRTTQSEPPTWAQIDAQEARDRSEYQRRYGKRPLKPAPEAPQDSRWSITTADGRSYEGTGQPPAELPRAP